MPRARRACIARRLATNDVLFQKGDTRTALYRVESGALCHFIPWDDGRYEVIEFAFPGDIVGLGHIDTHLSTAEAVVETTVSRVSPADFEHELATDGQLAARLAVAADREFEVLEVTRRCCQSENTIAAAGGAACGAVGLERDRGPRCGADRG